MNLGKKKELAMRAMNVGESRIKFIETRLDEIKEAITKQDIKDLVASGAIIVKPIKGRKRIERKSNRSVGNIRKKRIRRKMNYVILTRKLRKYLEGAKSNGLLSKNEADEVRKKIRNKEFKSKNNLKEYLNQMGKVKINKQDKKIVKKTRSKK